MFNLNNPTQKELQAVIEEAIKIWQRYDDTYGYATKKITIVKNETNIESIVGMFDLANKEILFMYLSNRDDSTEIQNLIEWLRGVIKQENQAWDDLAKYGIDIRN